MVTQPTASQVQWVAGDEAARRNVLARQVMKFKVGRTSIAQCACD
jgi:hypothetical protein